MHTGFELGARWRKIPWLRVGFWAWGWRLFFFRRYNFNSLNVLPISTYNFQFLRPWMQLVQFFIFSFLCHSLCHLPICSLVSVAVFLTSVSTCIRGWRPYLVKLTCLETQAKGRPCPKMGRSKTQYYHQVNSKYCRSRWPRGLRRRSSAARLLRLWVRIPPVHGCLSVVSVVCCQVEVSATD
jgi:hypothetical protein